MNFHYEFWVRYYDFLALSDANAQIRGIYDANERIVKSKWNYSDKRIPFQEHSLCMKVQYPGLLVGLGNTHDSGVKPIEPTDDRNTAVPKGYVKDIMLKSEIGLGCSLDHITGLPVIPGSQVKGILRSAFINNPGYIAEILGWEDDDAKWRVGKLEQDIFGGRHPSDKRESVEINEIGRDCFFDALPVKANRDKHLFAIENITPHRSKNKEYERLNSPDILQLLKVVPGVVFQFRFILKDSIVDGHTVAVHKKLKLFSEIFQDLGIGAKTSVGFGSVIPLENKASHYTYLECQGDEEVERHMTIHPPTELRRSPTIISRASQIQPGVQMEGRCLQDEDSPKEVLLLEKPRIVGIVQGNTVSKFKPGVIVRVRIISIRPNVIVEII